MENIKTWADFVALNEEDREALTPEEMETLKNSIAENEAKLAEEQKARDERLAKAEELAENYKIRAEKAEKAEKKKETQPELSTKDVLYLAKADIHEDDLTDVLDWAKFKNISVLEAHKQLKGILDVRNEERTTAAATDTKGGRPATQVSGESLLEKAEQGQISGEVEESKADADIDKIVEARMQRKLKK
jgi:hypothetical protein